MNQFAYRERPRADDQWASIVGEGISESGRGVKHFSRKSHIEVCSIKSFDFKVQECLSFARTCDRTRVHVVRTRYSGTRVVPAGLQLRRHFYVRAFSAIIMCDEMAVTGTYRRPFDFSSFAKCVSRHSDYPRYFQILDAYERVNASAPFWVAPAALSLAFVPFFPLSFFFFFPIKIELIIIANYNSTGRTVLLRCI